MRLRTLDALQAARAAARPVALATNLKSGEQRLIFDGESQGELCLDVDMLTAAVDALHRDAAVSFVTPAGTVFVQPFNPPPRLIVIGAVHIAEPLVRMAQISGYGIAVLDPRRAFAASARLDGLIVSHEWPDEAMEKLKPDARTAIVALTHDPKIDDPGLDAALRSSAFYIGALGSKKTHAKRLERLGARGFDAAALARIHGPIGLAIGAKSPAEIAVAIVAEITKVRRGGAAAA